MPNGRMQSGQRGLHGLRYVIRVDQVVVVAGHDQRRLNSCRGLVTQWRRRRRLERFAGVPRVPMRRRPLRLIVRLN